LDGGYGSPGRWSHGDLSLLELELFMAALTGKPIRVFLLDPFQPDPRLDSLLKAIRVVCPDALDEQPKSEEGIKAELVRMLEKDRVAKHRRASGPLRIIGYLVQYLARVRALEAARSGPGLDVLFLDGKFAPIHDKRPDKDQIADLLRSSDSALTLPAKLAKLWVAFRYLSAAPYSSRTNRDFLSLWTDVLSRWASSSAWYGLHGHIFLGRLAAVNTLLELTETSRVESGAVDIANSIQSSYGAIASEYYSIAKMVPSRRYKRMLLDHALEKVERALEIAGPDISGLLSIRASVRMARGKTAEALEDFKVVLGMRIDAGDSIGRIGEAESRLGFAYFRRGRIRQAERLLESGVAHLESSDRTEFMVRAMRQLSLFYALTLRRSRALTVLRKAFEVAESHELEGQLLQLHKLSRVLLYRVRGED
jgi:tetratricopeptide (TPR) repeat protein